LVVEVALKQTVELQLFQPLLLPVVEVAVVRYLLPLNLEVLEAVVVPLATPLVQLALLIRAMPVRREPQCFLTTVVVAAALEKQAIPMAEVVVAME
jgi:hypothetical protein